MNCTQFITLCLLVVICVADFQLGPDPWNYDNGETSYDNDDIPPDLRTPVKKEKPPANKLVYGEFWFKRILTIVLKNGQLKKNEDNSVEVSLQMKFDEDKWNQLDEYLKSGTLTDAQFRSSVGYVEEAIYKPTITEKIIMAWSDYVQVYLTEYKTQVTWSLAIVAVSGGIFWMWQHISHKHVTVLLFCFLYGYEVIISYKEAEQKELDKFLAAVNTCKWYFWTSNCDVPSPDPLIFMKHMNPLKIGIRMFTSLISEPFVALNSTIILTIQSMTDQLWFPFNTIAYIILIVVINFSLILLLVMLLFHFLFNIPFNFSMLGIARIGVDQRKKSLFSSVNNDSTQRQQAVDEGDKLSGDRLDRLFNFVTLALNNAQNSNVNTTRVSSIPEAPKIKRSASTGRLPFESLTVRASTNQLPSSSITVKRRNNVGFHLGTGDH